MENFNLRDALALLLGQPRIGLEKFGRYLRRCPPIPLAQDADKVVAVIHGLETPHKALATIRLLFRDAPPEIHPLEGHPSLATPVLQVRKHLAEEVSSLVLGVSKCGRDEYSNFPVD